jgi:2',3'-cyclic-nucleotide 2'-phosphodiesterase (5'-nucleotidase family)
MSKRSAPVGNAAPAGKICKNLQDDCVILQLVCTNDTHSKLDPIAYKGGEIGGVLRREVVFREMQSSVQSDGGATLVLDAGDHFSGSNYFNFLQGEAEMSVLEALGYNAAALGNHDFDARSVKTVCSSCVLSHSQSFCRLDGESGFSRFKTVADKFAPSVQHLCGNVLDGDGEHILQPFTIFEPFPSTGIKVGVAAVLGKSAWDVTGVKLRVGLSYTDYLESARASAEALRW